jgi:hypothetical protein
LPRNANGKISRAELRQQLETQAEYLGPQPHPELRPLLYRAKLWIGCVIQTGRPATCNLVFLAKGLPEV